MRFLANGNIGIGISAPSEKLHINGNFIITGIQYVNGGDLYARTGNSEKGIFFRSTHSSGSNKYNSSILIYDHGGGVSGSTPDGISINAWDGISFCTASNTRNERMRIASNGNVGIGTTNPTSKLQIYNSSTTPATGANTIDRTTAPTEVLRLQSKYHTGHGSGALMRFTNHHNNGDNPSNDEYPTAFINGHGTDKVYYTGGKGNSDGGDLVPRILINSDGNVGIGTNTPAYP